MRTFAALHMYEHEPFMQRCLELAARGAGWVAPNPMVGAVLVHGNRIIGEGWHRRFGGPHAEVHCLQSVAAADRHFIPDSTLYVSLEPCAHYGKTPPCSLLIRQSGIKQVVVGCADPFEEVNGKGIADLKAAGIAVQLSALETQCRELNRRFFTFHEKKRPYIILKWAQTADGFMGTGTQQRLHISHAVTNLLVHRWRSEEASILVGSQTALLDDPLLTNRSGVGLQPVRLVFDRHLQLPAHLRLFNNDAPTVVLNYVKQQAAGQPAYVQLDAAKPVPQAIAAALHTLQLQSVLVEGGARLLQAFLQAGLFDEIRMITNESLHAETGIKAPTLPAALRHVSTEQLGTDTITIWRNTENKL
ncbi:MAG: bifunctional diaminohydroxyphosphoribosylaminopyrimidine deaminase/5-amino-6-(5-phosphoribosylamino)uracil reductase RibD [Lacibacter sp.]